VHHALERIQDLEYVHPRVKRNISGAHNHHVPGNPWLAFFSNCSCKKFSSTMGTCELFSEDFFSWIFLHSITSVLDWKFLSFYGGCSVSNFWQPKQLVICAVWMRCTWPFALRYAQNLFQIPIKSVYHL
jgi:hypothetical protein